MTYRADQTTVLAAFTKDTNKRSSGAFPIFTGEGIRTKLLFLGYWKLKNNLPDPLLVLTLRDQLGTVVEQRELVVNDTKAYELDLPAWFPVLLSRPARGFTFSIEAQLYFQSRPAFNYPAIALAIESEGGTSVVHACCRSYNPDETASAESKYLPQTGFNLHIQEGVSNYVAFIGGPGQDSYNLKVLLIDEGGNVLDKSINFPSRPPGRLCLLTFEDLFGPRLIEGRRYRASIRHDLEDVFPRLFCGNYSHKTGATLTHSFFDTSDKAMDEQRSLSANKIANPDRDAFYDSVFCAPLFPLRDYVTRLTSYGCNARFEGTVTVSVHSVAGEVLWTRTLATDGRGFLQVPATIDIGELLADVHIDRNAFHAFKVAFQSGTTGAPTRQKFGLDIARRSFSSRGTNICFAPMPIESGSPTKRLSRRWGLVGGKDNFVFFFHNTSFRFRQPTCSDVGVTFFNVEGKSLRRDYAMRPDETLTFDARSDPELRALLQGSYGWAYCATDSFSCDAWYFSLGQELVGGDHAF